MVAKGHLQAVPGEEGAAVSDFVPIPGAPLYGVDRLGGVVRLSTMRPMRPRPDRKGYLHVRIQLGEDGKKAANPTRSSIVLRTFIGPRPSGFQAAHLNGDNTDDRLENLAWVAPAENERHKRIHGTALLGTRNHQAKLTDDAVRFIRANCVRGWGGNVVALAEKFGVSQDTVRLVEKGVIWKHVVAELKAAGGG